VCVAAAVLWGGEVVSVTRVVVAHTTAATPTHRVEVGGWMGGEHGWGGRGCCVVAGGDVGG